jgi:hypothetical protein
MLEENWREDPSLGQKPVSENPCQLNRSMQHPSNLLIR